NSSESEIFQKQNLLYNFDLAKGSIRKEKEVILFEGQVDVITAFHNGLKNVVATLGTALTERQAKLLRRYANRVILCYDGDSAGQEASYRAAKLLQSNGFDIKIANMNSGDDPHTFITKNGIESFNNQIIKLSDSYIVFYMRYIQKDYNLNSENEKLQYIRKLIEEIALIDSSVEREYYLKQINEEFSISIDSLQEELNSFRLVKGVHRNNRSRNRYTKTTSTLPKQNRLLPAFHRAERELISIMLNDESIANYIQNELGANFTIDDHKIIVTTLYAFYEEGQPPNVGLFLQRIKDERIRSL